MASTKLPPRATTSTGKLSARIKPKAAKAEKLAPSLEDMVLYWNRIDLLWRYKNTPGGLLTQKAGRRGLQLARAAAPVSSKGSHGRKPGYLRSKIGTYVGEDSVSMYVDIVTRAQDKHHNYYGRIQNQKKHYLSQALNQRV